MFIVLFMTEIKKCILAYHKQYMIIIIIIIMASYIALRSITM